MNEHASKLVAGFLALGVIGAIGGYLGSSLMHAAPTRIARIAHPHADRIYTVRFAGNGCRRPSTCSAAHL